MGPLKVWIVFLPEKKGRALLFSIHQVYNQKALLCRSYSFLWSADMAARLLEVRRRFPVAFFVLFSWNLEFLQTFAFIFVCRKYPSFYGQKGFLLSNAEFTKRPLLREWTGVEL